MTTENAQTYEDKGKEAYTLSVLQQRIALGATDDTSVPPTDIEHNEEFLTSTYIDTDWIMAICHATREELDWVIEQLEQEVTDIDTLTNKELIVSLEYHQSCRDNWEREHGTPYHPGFTKLNIAS